MGSVCGKKNTKIHLFVHRSDRQAGLVSMLNLFTSQIMKINRQWGAAHFYRYHFVFLNKDFVFFKDFGGYWSQSRNMYCSRVEVPLVPPWSSQPAKYHIFQINLKYASTINRKEGKSTIFYLLHSHNPSLILQYSIHCDQLLI